MEAVRGSCPWTWTAGYRQRKMFKKTEQLLQYSSRLYKWLNEYCWVLCEFSDSCVNSNYVYYLCQGGYVFTWPFVHLSAGLHKSYLIFPQTIVKKKRKKEPIKWSGRLGQSGKSRWNAFLHHPIWQQLNFTFLLPIHYHQPWVSSKYSQVYLVFNHHMQLENMNYHYHLVWEKNCLFSLSNSSYWGNESYSAFYLLHGDLWLGCHVLLGVAHTSSIFVLGHGTHWGSSGWSTGRALAEGLGGWGKRGGKKEINSI